MLALKSFRGNWYMSRGWRALGQHSFEKAVKYLEKSETLEPEEFKKSWFSQSLLGRAYLESGRYEDALAILRMAYGMLMAEGPERWGPFEEKEFALVSQALIAALERTGSQEEADNVRRSASMKVGTGPGPGIKC